MRFASLLSLPSFTVPGNTPAYAKDWVYFDFSELASIINQMVPSIFRAATVGLCVFVLLNIINWIISLIMGNF